MKTQAEQIRQYLIDNIENYSSDIVNNVMNTFNVSRTTVHRHLDVLVKKNLIVKSGTTRNISYALTNSFNKICHYHITANLSEFKVLVNDYDHLLEQLPENVYDICSYGFTEIFNNAIDHSRGKKISVTTSMKQDLFCLIIEDDGIGVFKTICDYLNLSNERESIIQLSKGKITTDPARHTGEGIFFSSRAFDRFEIYANNLYYLRDNNENDWSYRTISEKQKGSKVIMTISSASHTNIVDIFKQYQDNDSLEFDRTEILVELSRVGDERLISRSQAKRICIGLDKFKYVTLDFKGIRMVGQGFVDEIFRVYQNEHPIIVFDYINANDDVTFMIERGVATAKTNK